MIGVVTDSSSDLPPDLATSRNIAIVPLTVRFGEEVLTDRVDLDTAEFWRRLSVADHLPETAAPSPGAFMDAFNSMDQVDGIVCLCISSQLSGTYQAALLAAEQVPVPAKVIDSRVVSMALGLATLAAADIADAGGSLDEVAAAGHAASRKANVFAALDTLTYLERGGRIGRVSALLGGLLDIKPIITLNDGVVAAGGRARTRNKAVAAVASHLASKDLARLALVHSGGVGVGDLAASLITPAATIVAELGPVVGTHTGPGVIGAAYVEN